MKQLYFMILALFMVSCYESNNRPYTKENVDNLSCYEIYKANHKVQPLSFPRKVYINPDSLSEDQIDIAIISAIEYNSRFSYEIFEPVISNREIDSSECGTIYMVGGILEDGPVGLTEWNSCSAKITIEPPWTHKTLYLHELGHALNLRHENNIVSIMNESFFEENTQSFSDLSKCLINLMIFETEENKNKSKHVDEFAQFPLETNKEICYHDRQY